VKLTCRSETWAWDVRTKHVTYEPIPTVEYVRALAAYGPTGTLFTLGPDNTVQQYDLEHGQMVANMRHMPAIVPPTPPEDNKQLGFNTSESEEEVQSPVGRNRHDRNNIEAAKNERNQMTSPYSNLSSNSRPSSRAKQQDMTSPAAKSERTATTFSMSTQMHMPRDTLQTYSNQSPVSTKSGRKTSRLRQEVLRSPEDQRMHDLFPYTRARLSDVPYRQARTMDESHLTPDDLRRQMLSVVFGWDDDIRDLVHDELSRHEPTSPNAILLTTWLSEDPDYLAQVMGSTMADSGFDWMLLALSTLDMHTNSKKVKQVFVEKMLSRGDIHSAAAVLMACGERNDAIEVYVSRNHYLEAILLTCLLMPSDWQRQSCLVRNWGEHVVENSQQHLAIRCFACTGVEPTDPWTSPTAQLATARPTEQVLAMQAPEALQRYVDRRGIVDAPTPVAMPAPPTPFRTAAQTGSRITPQTSALKLITSFGPQASMFKFPGLKSDDRTPTNAASITPIAESAISRSALSPGGTGSYRMNNIRSLNSALSAKTATPGGFHRHRLPSIGETPVDVEAPMFPIVLAPQALPTPVDSGSDKEKENHTSTQNEAGKEVQPEETPTLLLTSARYEPADTHVMKETPQTAVAPQTAINFPPSGQPAFFDDFLTDMKGEQSRQRTGSGSRSRKPDGLSIQMVPVQEMNQGRNGTSDYNNGTRGPATNESTSTTQLDTNSDFTSPPTTGNSYRSLKSPSVSGRSIDQYISSLEQAQYYSKHVRPRGNSGVDQQQTRDDLSERKKTRKTSDGSRGRHERRAVPASKRSPSSPVPMSPDDLRLYSVSVESFDSTYLSNTSGMEQSRTTTSQARHGRRRSDSTNGTKVRQRSRSRHNESRSKPSSRGISRRNTPDPSTEASRRGRTDNRKDVGGPRSPSSPLPMVPSEADRQYQAESDPSLRLVSRNRQRLHRSTSRQHERGTSARRDTSPDRRRAGARSRSRQADEQQPKLSRKGSLNARSDRRSERSHDNGRQDFDAVEDAYNLLDATRISEQTDKQLQRFLLDPEIRSASNPQSLADMHRKGLAAAELEARRLSLARRPSAPPIPFPGQNNGHIKSASTGQAPALIRAYTDTNIRDGSYYNSTTDLSQIDQHRKAHIGTPQAMQRPSKADNAAIPAIPHPLETLASGAYRPSTTESSKPGSSRTYQELVEPYDIPLEMPKHHAFDVRIANSRSSSKGPDNRNVSPRRGVSRERPRTAPRDVPKMTIDNQQPILNLGNPPRPPILPELQHLVVPPPPPPPPPAPAKAYEASLILHLQTDVNPSTIPLPLSALTSSTEPTSATAGSGHRRGRSRNELSSQSQNQFMGKIRSMTERMRSTSRGRDNFTRSPQQNENPGPSPYETSLPSLLPVVERA